MSTSNATPEWFRPRGYRHFDYPLSVASAAKLVKDPLAVASHAFWPLLHYVKRSQKFDFSRGRAARVKRRQIMFASHSDSHIYAYYAHLLSKMYEDQLRQRGLSNCVLAYRRHSPSQSTIHFARSAFDSIRQLVPCTALAFDVSKFFDSLNHAELSREWSAVMGFPGQRMPPDHAAVFRSVTSYSHVSRNTVYSVFASGDSQARRLCSPQQFRDTVRARRWIARNMHKFGIPQGLPISGVLANIYMLSFDEYMQNQVTAWGGVYFRYSDDILVVVPSSVNQQIVKNAIDNALLAKHLAQNDKKLEVSTFVQDLKGDVQASRPLQYLGFIFNGTQCRIRSSSLARYWSKMERGVARRKLITKSLADKGQPGPLFVKRLLRQYSHFGRANFISYALRAERILNPTPLPTITVLPIHRQLRRHMQRLLRTIAG